MADSSSLINVLNESAGASAYAAASNKLPEPEAELPPDSSILNHVHQKTLSSDILNAIHPSTNTASLVLPSDRLHRQEYPLSLDDSFLEDSGSETLTTCTSAWGKPSSLAGKRYQPSPTPSSSNASVIASEEEEEGFEDVDFPSSAEALQFVGDKPQAFDELSNDTKNLLDKMKGFEESGNNWNDDDSSGFSMPDDFTWHRKGLGCSKLEPVPSAHPNLAALSLQQAIDITDSSTKPKSIIMSKPVKSIEFGDGTELDFLDDIGLEPDTFSNTTPQPQYLPHSASLKAWAEESPQPQSPVTPNNVLLVPTRTTIRTTSSISVNPEPVRVQQLPPRPSVQGLLSSSLRRSDSNLSRWVNPQQTRPISAKKVKKKPTLIRNVNPADIAHVVGVMKYDPVLQKWSGNEEILLDFDKSDTNNAPSKSTSASQKPRARPALITNKTGLSQVPHVVGNMVFDPVEMRWMGNEEDADVFAGLDDASFLTEAADEDNQKYFVLTKNMKQALYVCDSSHKLFMGKWYPKAVQESKTLTRDTSKSHLYDVRTVMIKWTQLVG